MSPPPPSRVAMAAEAGVCMDGAVEFLLRHGYWILFVFVFLEQIGLPMPALPILLAAGALARGGQLDFASIVVVAMVSSLIADGIWYEVGRRRGAGVLRQLCRISLEPDSCVRTTENLFDRFGSAALILAKFVPGFNTAAPPLAGIVGMGRARFVAFDLVGAFVWAAALMGLGFVFHRQVEGLLALFGRLGAPALAAALAGLGVYVALKFLQRRRIMRDLRIARISAPELRRRLEAGEPTTVIDMRHRLEQRGAASRIPGAIEIAAEQIEQRLGEVPRERDVVLVCT